MIETFLKIWKFGKGRHDAIGKALIFSFLHSFFGICEFIAIIIAVMVLTGKMTVNTGIMWVVVLTLICIIGNYFTSYGEQINAMKTGFLMTGDKRVSIGNVLRKLPLGFFNQASSGKITAILTTTLSGVEMGAVMIMIHVTSGLFNSLVLFLFMLFYNWKIGLISGIGMLCYLLVVNWQIKVSRKNAPKLQDAQKKLAENTLTFLKGIKVIKSFSFKQGDEGYKEGIEASRKGNIDLTNVSMPSQFAANLTIGIFESIILMFTLYSTFVAGNMEIMETVILIIFSFMVFAALNQAGSMLSMIGILDSCMTDVDKIENSKQLEIKEPVENSKSNEIVLENVSFSFDDHKVLDNVSAKIPEKSLTAIIGPSGSGKTTLCQLIPRFRDIDEGKIMIGGADIRHLEYEDLMKKISMVFQNVYLFEDTILNNIRFGKPDASLEEVENAAKLARCHDFIMSLPDGYNTLVKEGGSSLSGGEKQRISIARAILKDSPIIILDEATSALDAENEQEILAAINELIKDKTVIMIAHRIKSVEKADCIIALKDGKVVQMGKHEELIKEDGLYNDFLNSRREAEGWQIAH